MAVFLFLFACGICLFAGRWLKEDEEFLIYTESEPLAMEEKAEISGDSADGGVFDIDKEAEEALNRIYNGGNGA